MKYLISIILIIGIFSILPLASAQSSDVPDWVKNNTDWWAEEKISKRQGPTYEQVIAARILKVDRLDRVFQDVFDKDSNSFFSKPIVIFVSPGMKSLQPRGPSVLDSGSTFPTSDPHGITAKLIGPKTPKVYGTGTGIVCGDKLCKPHPFESKIDDLREKIKSDNTAEAMMILEEISNELATKYPNQSVQLQGYLSEVMMPASAEKQSRIPKDVDINCEGKVWLESINGRLACTFPSTATKLVERGWGKILE